MEISEKWNVNIFDVKQKLVNNKPLKILIFDIETLPMVNYTWGRFKQDVALSQTIKESCMLCWAAKWLYEETMMSDVLTPDEVASRDDYRICLSLHKLIDEANAIVAYNGKKFDVPFINTRFLCNEMVPCKPVKLIDPYIDVKHNFKFSSNKMDEVATMLGLENKISTDFELWRKCDEGNRDALKQMVEYNRQDVVVLEQIYDEMLPWLDLQSSLPMRDDKFVCMACGSSDYAFTGKYYYTPFGKYKLYRCANCGKYFRSRQNEYGRNGIPFAKIAK